MGKREEGWQEVTRRDGITSFARVATWLSFCALTVMHCAPELGDAPFACSEGGLCPADYECVSDVCVPTGDRPSEVRAMRLTWINSGEMYWFANEAGGVSLVVNDGFTPSLRGLYEIDLGTDGSVGAPRLILDFAEDYPTATAVVSLDDANYGVVSMRFPAVDESAQTLRFTRVPKKSGTAEVLFEGKVPFVGGTEPAYVSALARNGKVDVCFSDATDGGQLTLLRLDESGTEERRLSLGLPLGVLPLSGDCHLWEGQDELFVRIGLAAPIVYRIADTALMETDIEAPIAIEGLPVFADQAGLLAVSADANGSATLQRFGWSADQEDSIPIGVLPETLELHTAVRSPDGALLLAPTSQESGFADLAVLDLADASPSTSISVARSGSDEIYSGRAFTAGGRTYLAWTALHEDLMDLWIASAAE